MSSKMMRQSDYTQLLCSLMVNEMAADAARGVADNPQAPADRVKQNFYLAWMSAGVGLAVNAAANAQRDGNQAVMASCMQEIAAVMQRHFPVIPNSRIAISGQGN